MHMHHHLPGSRFPVTSVASVPEVTSAEVAASVAEIAVSVPGTKVIACRSIFFYTL